MAFSTANPHAHQEGNGLSQTSFIPNAHLDPVFEAVIQAVDEAVVNAMVANDTMVGHNGARIEHLPREKVFELLKKHEAV